MYKLLIKNETKSVHSRAAKLRNRKNSKRSDKIRIYKLQLSSGCRQAVEHSHHRVASSRKIRESVAEEVRYWNSFKGAIPFWALRLFSPFPCVPFIHPEAWWKHKTDLFQIYDTYSNGSRGISEKGTWSIGWTWKLWKALTGTWAVRRAAKPERPAGHIIIEQITFNDGS